MASDHKRRAPGRVRNTAGAASLRVLLAIGASTGLTGAVALPMAYQAYQARHEEVGTNPGRDPSVLGTSITRPESDSDGVHWLSPDGGSTLLHGATITADGKIVVQVEDSARVDVRIDDGDVRTYRDLPVEITIDPDSLEVPLDPGPHTITATITLDSGVARVRQASFTVE